MKSDKLAGLKKDFGIMMYFLKLTSKMSKSYIPVLFLSAIFKALIPFINIIMPKFIIDELLGQKRLNMFIILCFNSCLIFLCFLKTLNMMAFLHMDHHFQAMY